MRSIHALACISALAALAPDDGGAAAAGPVAVNTVATMTFPNIDGERSYDCALIPADTRLDFLKTAVRNYIANRLNGVHTRHEKDPAVIAWTAYNEAAKADPLQTAVPKPEGDPPAAPNYDEAYTKAIADLSAGNVRKAGADPKPRKTKDPLIATVTDVVIREVFTARKAADPKYTFFQAKKEVGTDGIAYLNAMIDTRVAAGASRADLEKMRDTKYIGPAKAMLGITALGGKANDLPSIL